MDENSRLRTRRKKRKKKLRKWVIFVPILLVLAIIAYGGHLAIKAMNVTNEAHRELTRGEKSEKRVTPVYPGKDNFSVLFIGVDERPGEKNSRSDVLLLATFNKNDHSVKLLSIPRDSRVEIPGYKPQKINNANYFGGADLAVETVEELLDIPVDYYVKLNFNAFIDIVDALDGVTVDVPFTFTEKNTKNEIITLYEGRHTLDGEEALAYVRMRKQDPMGDFGRNERQKEVVAAVIKKAGTLSSITKYGEVLDSLEGNISTNLTFQNIVALHPYAKSISNIESLKLAGEDLYLDSVYYYALDDESVEETSEILKEHLEISKTLDTAAGNDFEG